jgi:hypothetical protein
MEMVMKAGFLSSQILRGSYVDGDFLRGFNFTAIRRQIDGQKNWPKSATGPTVH